LELLPAMRLVALVLLFAACRPPGYGKGDDGDDEPAGDDANDDADVDGATDADLDAAATCTKEFHLDGHSNATSVVVTGAFAAWATSPPAALALTETTGGAWEGSREFSAGSYQYKYVIDGTEWILDPTNPNTVDDGMGHLNSTFTCTP
jgi:hypothetical protein